MVKLHRFNSDQKKIFEFIGCCCSVDDDYSVITMVILVGDFGADEVDDIIMFISIIIKMQIQ